MECRNCFGFGTAKSIVKGVELTIPKNMSVTEYFRKCIIEGTIRAEAPAIISGDGHVVAYTFLALDSFSTRIAKALRKYLGFWTSNNPDGDLVMAFCLPVSEIIPVLILAILKLGATFLAIPTTFAEQHIVTVVGVTRPMIVITEATGPTRARYECVSGLLNIVGIDEILEMAEEGGFDDINEVFPLETLARPCKRMACIVYTPGTMDQPLAVRIGHPEILNRCLWQYKTFPYTQGEVAAVTSGLEDADSIGEIFAPMLAGIPCHLISKNMIAKPWSLIWRIFDARISRITLMPPAFAALLSTFEEMSDEEKLKQPLDSLKYYVVSGDALSFDLAAKFFDMVCPFSPHDGTTNHHSESKPKLNKGKNNSNPVLIHLYGATEVMSDVTYETFENCSTLATKFHEGKVSIGRPISNTIIYVVDEDFKVVNEGQIGEVSMCVAGACVASGGYVSGTEKEDSERFCPNPFTKKKSYSIIYQTEDFGRIFKSKDGVDNLCYEGRTEMTAKVMGKRVDLRDIMKYVNSTNLVEQCSVFCYHPEQEDQALVACCKLLPEVTEENVEVTLRSTIHDEHLIPKIFSVEAFRYLPSGRLDKRKLMKLYHHRIISATPEEWEPLSLTTSTEKGAAKILFTSIAICTGKPLKYIINNCNSSLWSLGVTSLNALTILAKIKEGGYTLPIDRFLKAESILSLVYFIEMRTRRSEGLEDVQKVRLLTLSDEQLVIKPLEDIHKDEVIELIGNSYSAKNTLSIYQPSSPKDFNNFCQSNWAQVMRENLSLVAYLKSHPRKIAGALLALDGYTKPKKSTNCPNSVKYILELTESSERGPKEHFIWKKKGTATQLLMLGTASFVSPLQNVLTVALLVEMGNFKAQQLGYLGTIISTANPLLMELCTSLYNSEVVEEVPIFKFRSKDKTKPFRFALEYMKLQVLYQRF